MSTLYVKRCGGDLSNPATCSRISPEGTDNAGPTTINDDLVIVPGRSGMIVVSTGCCKSLTGCSRATTYRDKNNRLVRTEFA